MESIEFFENPEYLECIKKWNTFHDLWEGKREVMLQEKYLPRHQLENEKITGGKDLRRIRESITFYSQFIRPFMDIWRGVFFRKDGKLNEDAKELLGENAEDIDGQGNSVMGFLRNQLFDMDYLYGRPIILVDALPITPKLKTDEVELGARAFFELLQPRHVMDWQTSNEKEGLNMLRFEFDAVRPRVSLQEEPQMGRFTRTIEMNIEGQVVSNYFRQLHSKGPMPKHGKRRKRWEYIGGRQLEGLERIPVVWRRFGESILADYAPEVQRHHILESCLDNGLSYQAWQRLYATGVNASDEARIKALSEYTIAFLADGETMDKIDPADPVALEKRIQSTKDQIFKKAMRIFSALPGDSRAAQGADTQREEKDNTVAIIQSRVEDYESMINEALGYYAVFAGREELDPKIILNKDISNSDVSRAMMIFQLLKQELDTNLPDTKSQILKTIVGDVAVEDPERVIDEIDAASLEVEGEEEGEEGTQSAAQQRIDALTSIIS